MRRRGGVHDGPVPGDQPLQCLRALVAVEFRPGQLGREQAEQVVHPVHVRCRGLEHVRLAQGIERALGRGRAQAKQGRDRGERERPERHGAEQAERLRLRRWQRVKALTEAGSDREVTAVQLGEPVVLGGEPACDRRDAPAGSRGQFRGDDADRERQP